MTNSYDHIDTWIFDLDNTLYPAECNLFAQIDVRMKAYISELLGIPEEEAFTIQKRYFHEHGTTLRGLMDNHEVEPADFLHYVHDIDYSRLPPLPQLGPALSRLPGRLMIYTNGTVGHAEGVLNALGLMEHFGTVFDIVAAGYVPKPNPVPYGVMVENHDIDPARAVLVEDIAKNLKPAKDLGMKTVYLQTYTRWSVPDAGTDYIDEEIDDLQTWLDGLASARSA